MFATYTFLLLPSTQQWPPVVTAAAATDAGALAQVQGADLQQ